MKYYFCLISASDATNPINIGKDFVYKHRADWVPSPIEEMCQYLTAGYVKGVDHVVKSGIAYTIMKNYIDLDEGFVVLVCTESVRGCDR